MSPGRLGNRYDLKNVFDLARYLLPTPPVPTPWRRPMLALGSSDPTRAICSTLIAEAFEMVGFPILPIDGSKAVAPLGCPDRVREVQHIRHYRLFVPRDFDVSPYFTIIKPSGIVTLAREERERTIRGTDFHAAATTSRHVVIAAARSTRCD
jgi:hypothetical protein